MTEAVAVPRQSVFYQVNDYWACGWYRCYVPGVALKALGYRVVLDEKLKPGDIEEHDVIVVQNVGGRDQLNALHAAKEAGKLAVVDLDDDVWNLSPNNPVYRFWAQPEVRRHARECVEMADLVTTPTHPLAERLRTMNPNVRVLPNMLPATGWDYPAPKEQREDRIVLGWAGSPSHGGDFRVVDSVIQQLLDRYPHVEFNLIGGPATIELSQHERINPMKATTIEQYPGLLETFDIGIIPLADTTFNASKSDLKFVEYSMLGIPSVASKLEPYAKTVKHGENGFLASNAKDWLKHLTRLIEDIELRRSIGAAAQAYARTRTIEHAVGRWERAYGLTPPGPDASGAAR